MCKNRFLDLTRQKKDTQSFLRLLRKFYENQLFNHDLSVKIVAQNKKDGKGKELIFSNKKSLLSKTRPKIPLRGYFQNASAILS